MSFDLTLPLVMLAAFGLFNLLLSAAVAVAWRAGVPARSPRSNVVLGIRLLPVAGSAALVLTVVLPAFLLYEPRHAHDEPGPLLLASALFALAALGDGIRRGLRTWRSTRDLLRRSEALIVPPAGAEFGVSVLNAKEPLVALVGGLRQRIVATPCVAAACDRDEFRQVLAHETARRDARDNLKLLMLLAMPDALAWLPIGSELTEHWRVAAELEADERASGSDPRKRVALASALVKVARLSIANGSPGVRSGGSSGIETRVRRLLAPSPATYRGLPVLFIFACAVLIPLLAMPLYAPIHGLIEILVAFGR